MDDADAPILVVDDLPQNVRLLEAVLAPRGYRGRRRRNSGAEALERRRRRVARPRAARHPHARDGRLRGLPRAARRRRRRASCPVGDDHGERRAGEGARRSRRAPTTSSPSRSTRPSCWRACARCCGSSATTTRSRRRPPSSPRGTASSSSASQQQVDALERIGRLRRFLSPQLAELVVSSGDDSFLESHRREITVVFCDLRGFTAFAETVEPEDVMAVLARVPRGAGRPRLPLRRHARALHRRRADGLLQRPAPVPGRARARGADGASRCATRVGRARRGLAPARLRPRLRRRHRAGLRDARAHRLRGALRLRGDRQRDQPRGAAVRRGGPAQILVSQRVYAAIEDIVVADSVGELALRGFSRPARAYNVVGLDEARARL